MGSVGSECPRRLGTGELLPLTTGPSGTSSAKRRRGGGHVLSLYWGKAVAAGSLFSVRLGFAALQSIKIKTKSVNILLLGSLYSVVIFKPNCFLLSKLQIDTFHYNKNNYPTATVIKHMRDTPACALQLGSRR